MGLALILQILFAIPSIIKTIIEIIRLIRSLPRDEQKAAYQDLSAVAADIKRQRKMGVKPVADTKKLETLLADLRKRVHG